VALRIGGWCSRIGARTSTWATSDNPSQRLRLLRFGGNMENGWIEVLGIVVYPYREL
jgi:hypothetical protein